MRCVLVGGGVYNWMWVIEGVLRCIVGGVEVYKKMWVIVGVF